MIVARRPPAWSRYILFGALGVLALLTLVTWAAFAVLRPTPPRHVAMATGPEGSNAARLGARYREILARDGIDLRLVPTMGVVANAALLRDAKSGVSISILPSGISNAKESPALTSLGTLYYDPLWLFYQARSGDVRASLEEMRISIGPEGSGSRALSLEFFARAGIIGQASERLLTLLPTDSTEKLAKGEIDGCVLLAGWESPQVQKLLTAPGVRLLSVQRAEAWVALYPFLNKVILPAGVANMADNIPPSDVVMVAPKASLVVREDLHPAIQYLLMEAALEIHSAPGVFSKSGEFPAAEAIDFPLSKQAIQFYKTGRPFFQRNLPFWLSVLVQQLLVLLIPLIGVLYPLLRFAPPAFAWAMRRRVIGLYKELSLLEHEIDAGSVVAQDRADLLSRLGQLEEKVLHFRVPTSFEPLVYDLRAHITLVRSRLERL